MFIVRLPRRETFDKQRVATEEKKKKGRRRRRKKVSEDLAGARQNKTPFSAATV